MLEPKHLAIRDAAKARAWVAGQDPAIAVYVRALSAVLKLMKRAQAAEPHTKARKKVDAQVAKLEKAYPGFKIMVHAPPLPEFDAKSLALEILGGHPEVPAERVSLLTELLARLYVEQCTDRFGLPWRPPTKPRGKDGIYVSTGKLQEDQLARLVLIGVATLFSLRSLERSELPIVAVAAGFDAQAKESDERLPAAFENRADKWRQESDVVARRLLTLLPSAFVKHVKPLVRSTVDDDAMI